jgi:hypothetical protein
MSVNKTTYFIFQLSPGDPPAPKPTPEWPPVEPNPAPPIPDPGPSVPPVRGIHFNFLPIMLN